MTTETELVNSALRKAGAAKRIMDINEAVGSAGIAQDILASERDDLMRSGVWNFSITRVRLAPLDLAPAFGFQYAYGIPSDCERVVSVHQDAGGISGVPYKLESVLQTDQAYINAILCNSNGLYLKYSRQITDPNLMTATFRQVLILRLAKIFAVSIAKSNALYSALDAEETKAYRNAKSVDGIEDYPDRMPEGSWARSRRGRWGNANDGGMAGGYSSNGDITADAAPGWEVE